MTTYRHRRLFALCAVIAAVTLAATGCHVEQPHAPTPSTDNAKALDELKALPSFEDTQTQVQAAVDEISSAASAIVPTITWKDLHGGATDKCERPYEQTGGKRYFLPDRVAAGVAVSEADWASILQAAKDAASKVGATNVQVMQDRPGNHDVSFSGATGLFIKVGYQGNLGISSYTGCRLPQDKK
jgi:Lipoprotein confined to pathogenic Mycobacterium